MRRMIGCLFSILSLALGVALSFNSAAYAADIVASGTCGQDATWTLDSSGLLSIEGTGPINDKSFLNHSLDIKSIIISPDITVIPLGTFAGCSNVESITIPFVGERIDIYGYHTPLGRIFSTSPFEGATLTEQYDTSGGTSFRKANYYIPDRLKNVTVLGGEIPYGAFCNCRYITNITIPSDTTSIKSNTFNGCSSLESIELPKTITSIPQGLLSGCSSLRSITIPYVGGELDQGDTVSPLGYIFGTSAFEGAAATKQRIYSLGSNSYRDVTYYIPESLESVVLTAGNVSRGAFYNCGNLKSVVISDFATSIEESAFYNCSSLESLDISTSVQAISPSSLKGCTSLKSLSIPFIGTKCPTEDAPNTGSLYDVFGGEPEALEAVIVLGGEIPAKSFYNFNTLKNVVLPESATFIGDEAFYGCSNIETINIPSTVTTIGQGAFALCNKLKTIDLPLGVSMIGESAFVNCTELEQIVIPEGVTSLSDYLFSGCSKLKSIYLPSAITTIGNCAIADCSNLSTIKLPTALTKIGEYAFKNSGIIEIAIPEGVVDIGHMAFSYCTQLTAITFPATAERIGESVLVGDRSLESLTIPAHAAYAYRLYDYTGTAWDAFEPPSTLKSVTIIGSGSVPQYAFYKCAGLEELYLGEGITGIEKEAFRYCTNLKTIVFPKSIVYLSDYAFGKCIALETVILPENLLTYEYGVFSKCSNLIHVVLPEKLEIIGTAMFDGCSSLKDVEIPASVNTIGGGAFAECSSLTEMIIPPSVRTIGAQAFYGCSSFKDFTIPDTVSYIGEGVFGDCSSLETLKIPFVGTSRILAEGEDPVPFCGLFTQVRRPFNDVPEDYYRVVYNNYGYLVPKSLKTVTVTGGSIFDFAFYDCQGLERIVVPEDITYIGNSAFRSCEKLTEFVVPEGVESIGEYAFEFCSGLKELTIPGAVDDIGFRAFNYCPSLERVYIKDGVKELNSMAFCTGCDNLKEAWIPLSVNTMYQFFFSFDTLTDIYYAGTEAQWKSIQWVQSQNPEEFMKGVRVHYCSEQVSGTMQDKDNHSIHWSYRSDNTLSINGDLTSSTPILVATYDDEGRLLNLVTVSEPEIIILDSELVAILKLFWIDDVAVPIADAVEISMTNW